MIPQLDAIAKAAEGLSLQSETDAPLIPFFMTCSEWERETGALWKLKFRNVGVAEFFERYVLAEGWENADEIATCEKFRVLQETIEREVPDARAWQWGGTVLIGGFTRCKGGGMVGVRSEVVET